MRTEIVQLILIYPTAQDGEFGRGLLRVSTMPPESGERVRLVAHGERERRRHRRCRRGRDAHDWRAAVARASRAGAPAAPRRPARLAARIGARTSRALRAAHASIRARTCRHRRFLACVTHWCNQLMTHIHTYIHTYTHTHIHDIIVRVHTCTSTLYIFTVCIIYIRTLMHCTQGFITHILIVVHTPCSYSFSAPHHLLVFISSEIL